MNNSFDPKNPRVKKAYQKRSLNSPPVLALTLVIFIALLFGGIALLYFQIALGWALIGFSALPAMLVFWIKNDLNEIPIGKSGSFTDLLSEDLLLLLSPNTTPADLIKILPKLAAGPSLWPDLVYQSLSFNRPGNFSQPLPTPSTPPRKTF